MVKKKCEVCSRNDYEGECHTYCADCYKHYIVNSLLAYVATYRHRSARQQLKLAVMSFYDDQAVNSAKRSLYEGLQYMDLGIELVNRVGSNNRSAKEAEVDDILDMLHKMDTTKDKPQLFFYAEDVTALPPAAPEAGCSMMTFFELITKQQQAMDQMQETITNIRTDVLRNTNTIREMVTTNSKPAKPIYADVANAAYGGARPKVMDIATEGLARQRRPSNKSNRAPIGLQEDIALAESLKNIEVPETQPPADSEFKTVTYKRNKPRANKGAATGAGSLIAGPDVFHVQITNVSPQITVDTIKEYVEGKDGDIKVSDIKDTSTEDWDTKRYVLTFESKSFETVMDKEFWPDRIYYKQWYKPRKPWGRFEKPAQ